MNRALSPSADSRDQARQRLLRQRKRPLPLHLHFTVLAAAICALPFATAFDIMFSQGSRAAPSWNGCLGKADLPALLVDGRRITACKVYGTTQLCASKDSDDDFDAAAGADDSDDNGNDRGKNAYNDDGEDDDDDEAEIIKPYGNRSLAWTKRYRRLNPYEKCRARVLRFGHRSKEDWDEAAASGQLGQCKCQDVAWARLVNVRCILISSLSDVFSSRDFYRYGYLTYQNIGIAFASSSRLFDFLQTYQTDQRRCMHQNG